MYRPAYSPAPTRNDRPFHLMKDNYGEHTLDRAVANGQITATDRSLITAFVTELRSARGISGGRANKITFALVGFRRYLGEYSVLSLPDLYSGILKIQQAKRNGVPYRKNTLRDYIHILKRFSLWLNDNGHSSLPRQKVQEIRIPPSDTMTKTASQLLTEEEVIALLHACRNSRDRALIATLYEGGFRIQELGTLTWEQVKFDDYGAIINVNEKTGRPRFIRLSAAGPYLATWRNDYPFTPEGEALVFLTSRKRPLQHGGVALQLRKIAGRAGITKHLTPHLFRHSRITHLLQKGVNESVIKLSMWGNINTKMFATYAHLTNDDIDHEFLRLYGIEKHPGTNHQAIEPRLCRSCSSINSPTATYCGVCGYPLTVEETGRLKDLVRDIEAHPLYLQLLQEMKRKLAETPHST